MPRGRRRGRRSASAVENNSRRTPGILWIVAALSSVSLLLCLVNAATCSFLTVQVDGMPQYSIGLFCTATREEDDTIWIWSAFFFVCTLVSIIVGNLLSGYHLLDSSSSSLSSSQRRRLWQKQSIVAALGAITTVPTFLLYQTKSCTALAHSCQWDYGSVLMILTCLCGIALVLLTQCCPPDHVFRCFSTVSLGKERSLAAPNDLKVDRTMPNDDDDEEDEAPTAILRIVGPVGHSEGVEVPMDHHHHLALTKQSQRSRLFPQLFSKPSLFDHTPMNEEDDDEVNAMVEEGRSLPVRAVPMPFDSGGNDLPLDPIFSSADAASIPFPYGTSVPSNPKTDDSSASSVPPKDPTETWKAPVIPNISLIDDVTEFEENDDDNIKKELPNFGGISAILDDLGSLEPTVLDGEESILDNDDDDAQIPPPPPPALVASNVKSKLSQWASALPSTRKRQRAPRLIKGYRLLDDSDIETAAYYMSPPLEILTLNLSTEQDEGLHLGDVANSTLGTSTYSSKEPEPFLEFSDDDDDECLDEKKNADWDDQKRSVSNVRSERPTVRDARPVRRKKRHHSSSDLSLASSGSGSLNRSLLSVTIEEETAADLEEDASSSVDFRSPIPMVRSRSAPNLARFYPSSRGSGGRDEVYDDIHMTGIHQYHAAHIFREKTSSSNRSEYEGSYGQRRRRRQLFDAPGRTPMLPPTSPNRRNGPSLFRAERALRAGIHDNSLENDEDENVELLSDGDSSSVPSAPRSLRYRNARIARLKRLQQQQVPHPTAYRPKMTNAAPYVSLPNVSVPLTKQEDPSRTTFENRFVEPAATTANANVSEHVEVVPSLMNPVHLRLRSNSSSSSSGQPKAEDEDTPNETLNDSVYSSSYMIEDSIGGDSYLIDLLDVQLAELNRPEGSMVGPDEASL